MPLLEVIDLGAGPQLVVNPDNGLSCAFPYSVRSQTAYAANITDQAFTCEVWFYVTSFTTNPSASEFTTYTGSDVRQYLVNFNGSFYLRLDKDTNTNSATFGKWFLYLYNTAQNSVVKVGTLEFVAETHYHLRTDYNPATKIQRVHVNNTVIGSVTWTTALAAVGTSASVIQLGHLGSNRTANSLFGTMDAFRLWRGIRTDAENTASWKVRSTELVMNQSNAFCAYDFDDVYTTNKAQQFVCGAGSGVYMGPSQAAAGRVRGSQVPYTTSATAVQKLNTL